MDVLAQSWNGSQARREAMTDPTVAQADLDLTDGKTRPPTTTVTVDLGFGVARIKHEWFWNDTSGGMLWKRATTLTLMTPSSSEDGVHEPAESCTAWMSDDRCRALVEAL
jgi:hypothetical protein